MPLVFGSIEAFIYSINSPAMSGRQFADRFGGHALMIMRFLSKSCATAELSLE